MDKDNVEYSIAFLLLAGIESDGEVSDKEMDRVYDRIISKLESKLKADPKIMRECLDHAVGFFQKKTGEKIDNRINQSIDIIGDQCSENEQKIIISLIKEAMSADRLLLKRDEKDFLNHLKDRWWSEEDDEVEEYW